MIHVLVRHKIADYSRWRATFDAALEFRQSRGERSRRIFRSPEDANDLSLLFEWENLESARQFMSCASACGRRGWPVRPRSTS